MFLLKIFQEVLLFLFTPLANTNAFILPQLNMYLLKSRVAKAFQTLQ